MNFRKLTLAAALATALTVAGTGIGQADPAKPAPDQAAVKYQSTLVDKTVVTTIDKGAFEIRQNPKAKEVKGKDSKNVKTDAAKLQDAEFVAIKNGAGKVVDQLPLTFTLDGMKYPLRSEISTDKRMLKLTPVADKTKATPVPKAPIRAKAIASEQENQAAQNNFMTQLGMATTVGSLVGTAIGAVLGIGLGVVFAGAMCLVPPFVQCIVTALPIVATAAGVGGIAGLILAGGPTLAAAGWDYFNTMQAAPGTTPYQARIDQANAQALAQARASAQHR